ncbi:2OG-Fe(II) oxygenase [Aspergillus sclerotiicarbonarius CBS 121057]|uniref:2OG-Fe(II) oxygenase n=1 Tax=Aspergillus sclerotiicarbonarius (strain CBS 121057 / IBT 28362) TaxID=1448318 RepID=A0A319DX30_ASPSB|nr:2OG-Fe(II) oxygenase [Aspergillus sclerotiicarbonarius CBS 121057]
MTAGDNLELPIIDLDRYIHPTSSSDQEAVIAEVREACQKYGFFQVKNHGVSMDLQEGLLQGLNNFFSLPKEDKIKLSFLNNQCRRGYEASGMSLRDGDALPDSKESFYIGREEPVIEPPGFHGPNVWPDLPTDQFREPIWDYYQATSELGKTIWQILIRGLGFPTTVMDVFTQRPIVPMKMIRYPPTSATLPGQFGVGAHTDFGGVTVLLQQPGKEGLEVWLDEEDRWVPVPSLKDVYVINCGDMIQKWSGGVYRSAKHRVINKADSERLSCATFWHGDLNATNPLNPNDPNRDTVGQLLVRRFANQFSLPKELVATAN